MEATFKRETTARHNEAITHIKEAQRLLHENAVAFGKHGNTHPEDLVDIGSETAFIADRIKAIGAEFSKIETPYLEISYFAKRGKAQSITLPETVVK